MANDNNELHILLLSPSDLSAKPIAKELIKQSKKMVYCQFSNYRSEVIEKLAWEEYQAIVMHDFNDIRDPELILRVLAGPLQGKSTKIVIGTSDFKLFKPMLEKFPTLSLSILNLPLPDVDVARQLLVLLGEVDLTSEDAKKYKVDVSFFKAFTDSCKDVLKKFSGNTVVHKKPFLHKNDSGREIAIRSLLNIKSPHFTGELCLAFPKEEFLTLYESVLFEKHSEINELNKDFILEMTNVIYGQAKILLNPIEYKLEKLIPAFAPSPFPFNDDAIIIPFELPLPNKKGCFYLEINPKG